MLFPSYQKVFPQDIECIIDPSDGRGGVFISNVEAAQNITTLKRHGIQAVLTAAYNVMLNHSKSDIPYYKHVPGKDHEQFDLSVYFDEAVEFIDNALKKTNILVHCMAGVSRSVALVLAFLIKKRGMNFDAAYSLVKGKRRIIHPNGGFIRQLRSYQSQCKVRPESESTDLFYSRFSTRRASNQHESSLKRGGSAYKPYESPLKKYYQSPARPRYQSPLKKYEPEPLHSHNSYLNPERPSTRDFSNLKYVNRSSKQKQDLFEMRIADIRKKYSQPQERPQSRHMKSKSIMENFDSSPFQYRTYDTLPLREPNMDRLSLRKLSSMYDHIKY